MNDTKKIITPDGTGVIIGVEFPETPNIKRYLVKMDKKVSYPGNIMAFLAKECKSK